ncbi:MAG: TAT-variant-translocated molybdopterin oxidoreductase, partial [Pyrinomonadaceae bacterium]
MDNDRHINFKLLRDRILGLSRQGGQDARAPKQYWRSLEELVDSPIFEEFVQREFPHAAEEWNDPLERRSFLKLMGASLALAGLSGCVIQPPEKVIPYVKQPEEEVPGKSLFFATAYSLSGVATPLLVRSNEGRPTKVEGNPDHPSNPGATSTDIFSQASILTLYDPDRSQTPLYRGDTHPWTSFVAEIRGAIEKENDGLKATKGAGLRFLTETITSPSLAAQIKQILTDFPEAKWHQYEPVNCDNGRAGAVMAFGQPVITTYDFSKADRILSFGSDFLAAFPGTLRYARDYAKRRVADRDKGESGSGVSPVNQAQNALATMNRLYVIETTPTITGANADHRFSVKPSEVRGIATALASQLGANGGGTTANNYPWLASIARDLQQHKGSSIVIPGRFASPQVHALVHAMNDALGNAGKTVFYTDALEANSVDQMQSLRELVGDIDAGKVDTLIIIGGNPAYNTPVDLRLDFNRLEKVKLRAHLNLFNNETSEICHWHIPMAHYLESWGDARASDGTSTIVQPLIAPLYEGRTPYEVLALFSDNYDQKPYDIVRNYWSGQAALRAEAVGGSKSGAGSSQKSGAEKTENSAQKPGTANNTSASQELSPVLIPLADFESWWRKCLHDGFIPNTALPAKTVSLKADLA